MHRAVVAVAILAATACGGSGSAGSQLTAGGALLTPHPLTVQVATDASRAASAVIGPQGGQVAVTTASGAAMTLVIPAGALLSSHTIIVSPLASVTGFPLKGGVLAGAQIQPDGLLLARPATLNVTLPAPPAGGLKTYGFGYRHSGAELHLMKQSGSGTSLSLTLWHFSGAGVGAGSTADADGQAANVPAAPEDQVEQAQALGQQIVTLLQGWDVALTGQIGQSPPNLPLLDTIYQQVLVFGVQATQVGRPDLAHEIYAKMALVLKTAADLALADCRSKPDAVEGLRVIRWLEWAQGHAEVLQQLDSAALEAGVVKCLRFRLDFTTSEQFTFPPEAISLTVESKGIGIDAVSAIPLKFAPATGDLKYDAYSWTVPAPMAYTMRFTIDRPFSVQDVSMNLDAVDADDAAAVVDGMSVTVDFGETSETAHIVAPGMQLPPVPFKSFYAQGMQNMHHDAAGRPNLYRIRGWLAGSEPQFASLHETCPCFQAPPAAAVGLHESQDTTWAISHTPE